MVSDKIMSVQITLGELAGKVSEDAWAVIRQARANLLASAAQISAMESNCFLSSQDTADDDEEE